MKNGIAVFFLLKSFFGDLQGSKSGFLHALRDYCITMFPILDGSETGFNRFGG